MDITFDLKTPDGKTAEALALVVEARRKELGETTSQACVAMAQNILRSLRAQTKVAKESQMDISVTLADDRYFPSFKRAKGSKVAKRVLRQGEHGPVVTPDKVVWKTGKYFRGQVAHSFEIEDRVAEGKTIKYLLVACSSKDATRYAKEIHKNRVKRHKTLAKHAVGVAMKALYDGGAVNDDVNQSVRNIARQNVDAVVRDTGFSEGNVTVEVHDMLNYAALALQNGQASVDTAISNALNKTMGHIQQRVKANGGQLDQSLKMSIDELRGAQI